MAVYYNTVSLSADGGWQIETAETATVEELALQCKNVANTDRYWSVVVEGVTSSLLAQQPSTTIKIHNISIYTTV